MTEQYFSPIHQPPSQSDPAHQQGCDRENVPDETTAEQTWPSEQELMDAEVFEMQTKRRKVPRGEDRMESLV